MKNWIYILLIFLGGFSIRATAQNENYIYYNSQDSTFTFADWQAHLFRKSIEENILQKEEIWNLYSYREIHFSDSIYIRALESQAIISDSLNINLEQKLKITQDLYKESLLLNKSVEETIIPESKKIVEGLKKEIKNQKKSKNFFISTTIAAVIIAIAEFISIVSI